jgi:hypothetical protein
VNVTRLGGSLVAFWLLAASYAVSGYATGQGTRLLGERELTFEARGSAPGDCDSNYSYQLCDDLGFFCAQLNGDPVNCPGNVCTGCSNVGARKEYCTSNRPWNSLRCRTAPAVAGGCGNQWVLPACQYNGDNNKCFCTAPAFDPNNPCVRPTVVSDHGPCIYVP